MMRLACVLLASALTGARVGAYIMQPSARCNFPRGRSCALAPRTAVRCASSLFMSYSDGYDRYDGGGFRVDLGGGGGYDLGGRGVYDVGGGVYDVGGGGYDRGGGGGRRFGRFNGGFGQPPWLRVIKHKYERTLRIWTPDVLEGAAATWSLMWKIQLQSTFMALLFFRFCQIMPNPAYEFAKWLGSDKVRAPTIFLLAGVQSIFSLAQWRILVRAWLFGVLVPCVALTTLVTTIIVSPLLLGILPFVPWYLARKLKSSDFKSWLDPALAWYKPYVLPLLAFSRNLIPPVDKAQKYLSIFVPFLYELVFRRGLQRKLLGRNPSKKKFKSTYIVVAILFSIAHLADHTAGLRAAARSQFRTSVSVALATCWHKVSSTFLASFLIFSPVFTRFGFRAAVGAHACWNLTYELCGPCVSYLLMKCGIKLGPFRLLLTRSVVSGCLARLCLGPWLRRRRFYRADDFMAGGIPDEGARMWATPPPDRLDPSWGRPAIPPFMPRIPP